MKKILLFLFLGLLPVFGWWFWRLSNTVTLTSFLQSYGQAGVETLQDLSRMTSLPVQEEADRFLIADDGKQGIEIQYADREVTPDAPEDLESLSLSFPKDVSQPLEIYLDRERVITIEDTHSQGLRPSLLNQSGRIESDAWYQKFLSSSEKQASTYLAYQSDRKTLLYALQKDHATGEKQLKSWTMYATGNGLEQEAYRIGNATVKINPDGAAEVFYFGERELKNQEVQAQVDPSLLARAQRVLAQDMGEDASRGNRAPDFLIPRPYFYDKDGARHEAEWRYDEALKTLSLELTFSDDLYPIALDPTLQFTAPAQSNTGSVITGETTTNAFGFALASGDFNADGTTDLAVGAHDYSSATGRTYIFYNDGSITSSATTADMIITGNATGDDFGYTLTSGDLNADGRTDLIVGAYGYSSSTGRAYIFYNDGSIPTTAGTADVTITGGASGDGFSFSLATGDLNADGKIDLVVGALSYGGSTGRAYIFYNDGSIPTTAGTADVTITGSTSTDFGVRVVTGDFNADGTTDLAVGAHLYSGNTGRVYLFYNDGSIPTTAGTADVTITGGATSNLFGSALSAADLNVDGRTDLVVGAYGYSTNTGRAYIFYNDGSIPTTAGTADVTITGGATSDSFGSVLVTGDLNADGKIDLAVGARGYSTNTGRAYIFYNDGSIPTTAGTADVIITGETTNNAFGGGLSTGDFNADGRTDLVVGANDYSSSAGRTYLFYAQNGQVNTNVNLTGNATSDKFGNALASGDFNADGKVDLAVGARGYSTNTGRVYLFYNDGSIPTTAATADVTITGGATSNEFGYALVAGDFNADGKTDLAVGADLAVNGRVYLFYNDGSIPTTAATADLTITTDGTNTYFGWSLAAGDLNADGKVDLVVGGVGYSTFTGRAYIFYNDGSIPTTAATADVIISGGATNDQFGYAVFTGDMNADGTTDLVVGAPFYSTNTGCAYIFYNDGSIPTTAATADVTITGGANNDLFGNAFALGDWNADGRPDLVVSAYNANTNAGRVYFFYNDGSYPTDVSSADFTITGENNASYFGWSLAAGDFNADGKTDLAAGAYNYSTQTGRTFLVYNDGNIPTAAGNADVIITGEATSNNFGTALTTGDWNNDGRVDLAVGASGYSTNTGRVYLYETRENFAWRLGALPPYRGLHVSPNIFGQEFKITSGSALDNFASAFATGDFNADGKADLVVGDAAYGSGKGRVLIFYADGSLPQSVSSADVVIASTFTQSFGGTLAVGDFNADGTVDLAAGAYAYGTNTGRAYIFYNDGNIPPDVTGSDVIITGGANNDLFGYSMTAADLNADGKTDLAVGAYGYSSSTGRVYIFYNDGSIPTTAATADVTITGSGGSFSYALTSGDLNTDGRTDLIAGAYGMSSNNGTVYIFYNDGSIPTTAATADVTITSSGGEYFGTNLAVGDFNADGRTDLVVQARHYSSDTGRVYIFYNDGSIPTTAATADVTITGEASADFFGNALASGDLNNDGRTDLVVGASFYSSSNTGRVYIFYNDGSIPTTAATADVIITGETTSESLGSRLVTGDFNMDGETDLVIGGDGVYILTQNDGKIVGEATDNSLGVILVSGDLNADGRTDLVVGAYGYSTWTGRVYIFYNDGSLPTTAATADVTITGEATSDYFGSTLTVGDLNADGEIDLVVGAPGYTTNTGRVYIFYNDGSIPTTAATADVTITGNATSDLFGQTLVSGDVNADGEVDLAVGATGYSSSTGRTYLFYNDGSIPTTAATADVTITGETTGDDFGGALTVGDLNADGEIDLVVGARDYSSSTGRAYIFYNDGSIPTTAATADVTITGETTGDVFGGALTVGDLNADGETDLAVSAYYYGTGIGRVYIFYNDGSIPTAAGSADVTITGETAGDYFGQFLAVGNLNADGNIDLVVSAPQYSSNTGRVYIFYNDGSFPSTGGSADILLTGETTDDYFGYALTTGDLNTDNLIDLAVGIPGYSGGDNTGAVSVLMTEARVMGENSEGSTARGTIKFRGNTKIH